MSYGTHKIKESLNVAHVSMTYRDDGAQVFTVGKGADAKVFTVDAGKHLHEIISELRTELGLE